MVFMQVFGKAHRIYYVIIFIAQAEQHFITYVVCTLTCIRGHSACGISGIRVLREVVMTRTYHHFDHIMRAKLLWATKSGDQFRCTTVKARLATDLRGTL